MFRSCKTRCGQLFDFHSLFDSFLSKSLEYTHEPLSNLMDFNRKPFTFFPGQNPTINPTKSPEEGPTTAPSLAPTLVSKLLDCVQMRKNNNYRTNIFYVIF